MQVGLAGTTGFVDRKSTRYPAISYPMNLSLLHRCEKLSDPPALSESDKGKSYQCDGCIDRDESPDDSGPAVNGDALVGKDISIKHAVDVNGD